MAKTEQTGLYDATNEHDACGVGMVVNIHGNKSHELVDSALKVLEDVYKRQDVNTLQERYFRELKEDCAINSASDAYYVSAIACFCLTFIFPPAVIGAAICVYRAKQLKKGGKK